MALQTSCTDWQTMARLHMINIDYPDCSTLIVETRFDLLNLTTRPSVSQTGEQNEFYNTIGSQSDQHVCWR